MYIHTYMYISIYISLSLYLSIYLSIHNRGKVWDRPCVRQWPRPRVRWDSFRPHRYRRASGHARGRGTAPGVRRARTVWALGTGPCPS